MIPTLRTERLLLRGWEPRDRDPFVAVNADPDVMRYLQDVRTPEETDDVLARIDECWATRGWGLWAVEVLEGPTFIGYIGLWPADFLDPPAVEIGWRLAANQWGHGYATEGARAALEFGFDTVGLDEIVSFTVPQNRASWRVMEKIGLQRNAARDFDHPTVDARRHPDLVRHVLYELNVTAWRTGVASAV